MESHFPLLFYCALLAAGGCPLQFVELLYRALMGSVIRTELLAASSWLLGKLASLRHE